MHFLEDQIYHTCIYDVLICVVFPLHPYPDFIDCDVSHKPLSANRMSASPSSGTFLLACLQGMPHLRRLGPSVHIIQSSRIPVAEILSHSPN
jgi:hypothetical protein